MWCHLFCFCAFPSPYRFNQAWSSNQTIHEIPPTRVLLFHLSGVSTIRGCKGFLFYFGFLLGLGVWGEKSGDWAYHHHFHFSFSAGLGALFSIFGPVRASTYGPIILAGRFSSIRRHRYFSYKT